MSELRKDYYVQDKFVLIPNNIDHNNKQTEIIYSKQQSIPIANTPACPYCPGSTGDCDNLVLSFVVKEGILQRLYDKLMMRMKIGRSESLNAIILSLLHTQTNSILISHFIESQHAGMT